MWNVTVNSILIAVGVLGTVYKNLEKELKESEIWRRIETIPIT